MFNAFRTEQGFNTADGRANMSNTLFLYRDTKDALPRPTASQISAVMVMMRRLTETYEEII